MDVLQWYARRQKIRLRIKIGVFIFAEIAFFTAAYGHRTIYRWWTTPMTSSGTTWSYLTADPKEENPATEADLNRMYAELNRKYFHSELPRIPVHFEDTKDFEGQFRGALTSEIVVKVHTTRVDDDTMKDYFLREYRRTLLHEMAHALIYRTDPKEKHGEHWKAEMRALANEGAFDDLLWSEESAKDP